MTDPNYFYFTVKYILNKQLLPFQATILKELWTHPFPMLLASRGGSKSWLLAMYAVLRSLLKQGSKIVICGAGFRQSKIVFEYMENIWLNAPVLRDVCGSDKRQGVFKENDRWTLRIGESSCIAIPVGTGDKIRGLRAHTIIADEFGSISDEIYENVIAGFAAVSADPYENVKQQGKLDYLKKKKVAGGDSIIKPTHNQSIIAGTAYYTFNHFYKYWKRYKDIVTSGGDTKKLEEIFNGPVPLDFDWKDYCVIRIPYDKLPKGMMDDKVIGRAKATLHTVHFQMEYGCVFGSDTDGFFRRSLIESCVTNPPIDLPSGKVMFHATVSGLPNKQYVYGIDPAAMSDNFAIVILELCPDHNRVVYSWTTNKKKHLERLETGQAVDNNFYGFVARKIRELMAIFPCHALGIDSQGGGYHVYEALNDIDKMRPGEQFIWPIIKPDKEQDTDIKGGLHILHLINFADANWTREANHGMKKDLEDKRLLFPFYDSASIELASISDNQNHRVYDTLEDCVAEIEEMKDEISTIVLTQTASGREHWDTPEIKLPGSKKGRMRKDRYSAVVIANAIARGIYRAEAPITYTPVGGFVGDIKNDDGVMYYGPDWFVQGTKAQSTGYRIVGR